MLAQWIGDVVGRMHRNGIMKAQVADEMGISREYLSMILNGKKEPKNAEQRVNEALDKLIEKQEVSA